MSALGPALYGRWAHARTRCIAAALTPRCTVALPKLGHRPTHFPVTDAERRRLYPGGQSEDSSPAKTATPPLG
jgi:hypothetical protein